ncbi:uncharacterized protein LOC113656586 [Tachysurus fulvidraco]|uniref:uncharacterized protein LOC113656586 n=1 Tax=Tachysurus fulvidraco TaxID=1234273 RepID=UPI001FEE570C|nr:uncharacterized protein LOC113656586 [Tachysurus fulvidraco]
MITLFVALCLLTSVKPSNIKEIHVKKVKSGEDVTMKCGVFNDKTKLVWLKHSFGKVPQLVGRAVGKDFRLDAEFNDGRFSVRDDKLFNLNIKNVTEEDTGTYFCVEMLNTSPDFTSGTLLVVEDGETKQIPRAVTVLENGESLTLQCSVQAITSSCEEPSVYWFRHGSGESDPGIIYTHGNTSDECKKSSEAGSPPQSCVYTLPKRNLTTSGKETLYCAVAECGQILFRNGNIPPEKTNRQWIVVLTISNVICVIVIIALLGRLLKLQKGASNDQPNNINQVAAEEVLNYAAVGFDKKPSSSRTSRAKSHEDVYAQVKVK